MIREDKNYDFFHTSVNDTMPYNVFLYWLDDTLLGNNKENTIPFSHSGAVMSIQYAPYINKDELTLFKLKYDTNRYKYKDDGSQLGLDPNVTPYVYRLSSIVNTAENKKGIIQKRLSTFKCYKPQRVAGKRDWRNESKLYQYPYSYAYIYDGITQPLEIKYHLCSQNESELWVRSAVNINADYSLWIKGYKGDTYGELEQFMCTTNKELPCVSNQYAQWLATNKNQMQAQNTNLLNSTITSAVAGAAFSGGNPVVAGGAGLVSLIGGLLGNNITQNATERDMRNLPNNLISRGGDIIHNMQTVAKRVLLMRYRQRDEYMQKIGDYFAMYGYKQNKIMSINTRNRYYYNFIKTLGVNIEGRGIPKEHLEELKSIYDNGVTIWHVGRSGVIIGDYSKDNYEV